MRKLTVAQRDFVTSDRTYSMIQKAAILGWSVDAVLDALEVQVPAGQMEIDDE